MGFEKLSLEERREIYNDTLKDIAYCCGAYKEEFEDMNGVCPECGRATCDGEAICGCSYSPKECDVCGARPCDGSC